MEALHALLNCREQLIIFIRNHMSEVVKLLLNSGVLKYDKYKLAFDDQSKETPEARSSEILCILTDFVQEDEKHYWTFIDFLCGNKEYEKTLHILESEYKRLKGEFTTNENSEDTLSKMKKLQHKSATELNGMLLYLVARDLINLVY